MLSTDPNTKMGDVETKLVQSAAGFLGVTWSNNNPEVRGKRLEPVFRPLTPHIQHQTLDILRQHTSDL